MKYPRTPTRKIGNTKFCGVKNTCVGIDACALIVYCFFVGVLLLSLGDLLFPL